MHSHQINDMAKVATEAVGNFMASNGYKSIEKLIKAALEKYWKDRMAVTWTVEDVIQRAKDIGKGKIHKSLAREILAEIHHNHDCSIGINWTTIDDAIIDLVGAVK